MYSSWWLWRIQCEKYKYYSIIYKRVTGILSTVATAVPLFIAIPIEVSWIFVFWVWGSWTQQQQTHIQVFLMISTRAWASNANPVDRFEVLILNLDRTY